MLPHVHIVLTNESLVTEVLSRCVMKSDSLLGITKPCTHLHPAPSTSTLYAAPPSSIYLHSAPPPSTQLISAPPSSLQNPQQYLNQNIAHNWAISPNLGQKIKNCPFRLKIGIPGILEVLILNPDVYF